MRTWAARVKARRVVSDEVRCITLAPLIPSASAVNTNCISVVTVTSWSEQHSCHEEQRRRGGWGGGSKIRKKKTHTLTNKQMSPNVWTLKYTDWKSAWWREVTLNVECLSPTYPSRLFRVMLILHATLSGGLRLCPSLADVLSGAGQGMTRLRCLEAAGRILCRLGAEPSSRWSLRHPRQDAQRRKRWVEALFSLDWEGHGWNKADKSSYSFVWQPGRTFFSFFFSSLTSSMRTHVHTCKPTRRRKKKSVWDTVSIDRKFAGASSGNIRLISGGYNGAVCHRGVPFILLAFVHAKSKITDTLGNVKYNREQRMVTWRNKS